MFHLYNQNLYEDSACKDGIMAYRTDTTEDSARKDLFGIMAYPPAIEAMIIESIYNYRTVL